MGPKEIDDLHKVQKPGLAVDVILFTIKDKDLKVALIKREEDPYFGKHALPGRFVRYEETIETTAKTALKTKGAINPDNVFLEQLYTFGDNLIRDTRIRTVTIVYYGLIDSQKIDQPNKFHWHSLYKLPELAFDHKRIVEYAIERLQKKVFASDFLFQLMAEEFTLTELQQSYEVILNKDLDKRNFRKKILEMKIIKPCHKKKMEGVHRPAELYSFIRKHI